MKPSELKLNYSEFCIVVGHMRLARDEERWSKRPSTHPTISPEDDEWLNAWELWDLACSPMQDEERKLIRYGHYLGWFAARKGPTDFAGGS